MKPLILFLTIFFLTSNIFAQQYLWTTKTGESSIGKFQRQIPLTDVTGAVLEFYDQYELYHDMAGYSKEMFIKTVGYGFKDWSWLNEVHELTVFAVRTNAGQGSVVIVLCVSNDNVNMLAFANKTIAGNYSAQVTISAPSEREKFARWFQTLLN